MKIEAYRSARGGGKTQWLYQQMAEAVRLGETVALLVPSRAHEPLGWLPVDVYNEQTMWHARGRRYDHWFVDNADLFQEGPLELLSQTDPMCESITLTYTPFEGSSLPRNIPKPPEKTQEEILKEVAERLFFDGEFELTVGAAKLLASLRR